MPSITGQPGGAAGAHGSAYTCDEGGVAGSSDRQHIRRLVEPHPVTVMMPCAPRSASIIECETNG